MNANEQAVAAVLAKYQDALNQSDTDAVMKLYASDGVFMPQHFPSSVGADAVRKAYVAVFEAITLSRQVQGRRSYPDRPRLGDRAHQFGRDRLRSTRLARAVRRPTRSSSCSRRSTTPGRSRATAFLPPTRRAHKTQGPKS